jgi:hypothetical protein
MRLAISVAVGALAMTLAACGPTSPGTHQSGKQLTSLDLSSQNPAVPMKSRPAKDVPAVDRSCIRYMVTGSARGANITYATPTGTSQASVAVPMTTTDGHAGARLCGFESGSVLYISAQNQGQSGNITCEIRVSEIGVVSRNTSQGAYSIAVCQSTLP